ncbi:MAG: hypothetical protein MN733_33270 [Nitrososphaera sp.]|nr:hypothetical protein [Nitrososphaera sp.]
MSADLNLRGKDLFDRLIEILEAVPDEEFNQGDFYGAVECGCIGWHARKAGIVPAWVEDFGIVFDDLKERLGIDLTEAGYLLATPEVIRMESEYLRLPREVSFSRKDAIRRLQIIRSRCRRRFCKFSPNRRIT